MADCFSDLLTLTLVTQPGYRPRAGRGNPLRFKDHFIFDPARAHPSLSKRARDHLRQAAKAFDFSVARSRDEQLQVIPLYAELKRRRGLEGSFFDFPDVHFETLAALPVPASLWGRQQYQPQRTGHTAIRRTGSAFTSPNQARDSFALSQAPL